jgi:hypothetical protein
MGRRRKAGVIAAALVLAWPGAAAAAAPRDAIRNLPILSHTSELNISSSAAAQSYQDVYRGNWRIDWLTKELQLPGAALRAEVDYATSLSDTLDRINGSSSDSREDRFNFRLNLSNPGGLRGFYAMEQSDVQSNRTPGTSPRVWRSTQNKSAELRWEVPKLPVLYARHGVRTTYEYFGKRQSTGSEEIATSYGLAYNAKAGEQPLAYRADVSLLEREVYLPQRSSTSQRRVGLAGMRSLALGRIGNLTLDYDYSERSDVRAGELRARTNAEGSYGMSLYGNVQGLPLEYNYNYRNLFRSYANAPGEVDSSSDLSFTYTPPLPAGRNARLNLRYYLRDYEAEARRTTQALQSINWGFSANPRVNGSIGYEHSQTNDELSRSLSVERERLQADLRYQMPKGRGDVYGVFSQETQHEPGIASASINTGLSANAGFNLDQRSRFGVFVEQQNYSGESGLFSAARSSDTTASGFIYSFSSGQGLALTANWRQSLTKSEPSAASISRTQLNLTLNYDTPAGWRYQLNVSGSDQRQDSLIGGEIGYRTEDTIQALVSYSF